MTEFVLPLPLDYRPADILAYHGRDRLSVSERVAGAVILKPIRVGDVPTLLEIDLADAGDRVAPVARCRLDRVIPAAELPAVSQMASRMLGLVIDPGAFEARMKELVHGPGVIGARAGLRIPMTATLWEAICWAVIGQQINLSFCAALRRSMIELTGEVHPQSGLRVHPDPAAVAALEVADLAALRFSRSKADYLIGVARQIADGRLNLDDLATRKEAEVEATLCAIRGIGPWTARYILLRGFGFADIAPVGDSGLATALQRLLDLPARPDIKAQEAAMLDFAPHRSLATIHLWASLADK